MDSTPEELPENEARIEWLALAETRMADVRAGKVVGIPAEEVMKNLRILRQVTESPN